MLSDQVLLKAISDMKGITGTEISVWNLDGEVLFATQEITSEQEEMIQEFLTTLYIEEIEACTKMEAYHLQVVCEEESPCYILMFEGLDEQAEVISSLCVNQLEHLLLAYKERLSKNGFLLQLLKGNIAMDDIAQKSERVKIKNNAQRVVFVIEPTKKNDALIGQTLRSLYVTGITDFMVEVEKTHLVFIKEVNSTCSQKDLRKIADTIVDTLNMEAMVSVLVGYGIVAQDLASVERSYREAKVALEVGRSFGAGQNVFAYRELGIGRLIHQLSDELCREFLQEILGEEGLAQFDDDTMQAAYHFFENDLNISRTARALYVHRNTLSYRLEKIQLQTGLDIRCFEDAITFKLAIMVSHHIEFLKNKLREDKLIR